MTDSTIGARVDRVEAGLGTLSSEFAGVKAQIEGQGRDLVAIGASVNQLGDKLDRARPGIGAIWAPLGVLFTGMSLIGGAIAVPQLARITAIEAIVHERADKIEQLRIDVAVLRHDAERDDRIGRPAGARP